MELVPYRHLLTIMRRYLFILALLCISVFCSVPPEKIKSDHARIQCKFEPRDTYFLNDSIVVLFLLTNHTDQDYHLLQWHNPLEGIRNQIFRITGPGGQDIGYRGIMVKRGDPVRSSYETLEAGKTIIAKVDLAASYQIKKRGRYRVAFTGEIWDHRVGGKVEPRRRGSFRRLPIACNNFSFEIQ